MDFRYLGEISYHDGIQAQLEVYQGEKPQCLFGFSVKRPTITLGKRAQLESEVRLDREQISQYGIEILPTDRGGLATLHTPGQLIIFPALRLDSQFRPRQLVEHLGTVTKKTLEDCKVNSIDQCQPGVYTDKGKIAFIGLRIDRKRVFHGISLNVANDLEQFRWISSCGDSLAKHDKLSNYGTFTLHDVFKSWCENFKANH